MTNPVQVTQDDPVLIWSHEHNAYWRPDGCGYTTRIGSVGMFPRAKAETIVASVNADPAKRCEIDELPESLAPANDRISELEAAVTRLTLALEMERGRGQPRGEHDRSFPDLRTTVGEDERQHAFNAAQLDDKCGAEYCFDAGWDARAALTPARTYDLNISDEEIDAAIRHGFGDATADALKADETGAAS